MSKIFIIFFLLFSNSIYAHHTPKCKKPQQLILTDNCCTQIQNRLENNIKLISNQIENNENKIHIQNIASSVENISFLMQNHFANNVSILNQINSIKIKKFLQFILQYVPETINSYEKFNNSVLCAFTILSFVILLVWSIVDRLNTKSNIKNSLIADNRELNKMFIKLERVIGQNLQDGTLNIKAKILSRARHINIISWLIFLIFFGIMYVLSVLFAITLLIKIIAIITGILIFIALLALSLLGLEALFFILGFHLGEQEKSEKCYKKIIEKIEIFFTKRILQGAINRTDFTK